MSDVATNGLLTISMITNEALMVLENTLVFSKYINRQYDDAFGKVGGKIGTTLNVRRPVQYVGRTGPALQVEGSVETTVPLVMTTQRGVDASWSSAELALDVDLFSERFIKPMVANVANGIDTDGTALSNQIYSWVGTPGVPISSVAVPMKAKALLDSLACPRDNKRSAILDPFSEAALAGGLTNLFNPSKDISDQYKDGTMGKLAGFKFSMDQNINAHAFGLGGGTPVVNGAGQGSSGPAIIENSSSNPFGPGSLITSGWADSTQVLNNGDVFSIAGVYSVNPQSRQSTGQLAQFVAIGNQVSGPGGALTIVMSPALYTSGQYQNVTGSPANGALILPLANSGASTNGSILFAGTSPSSLAFHEDAFTFASCDLQLPRGVDMAARVSDKKVGMSIRMVRAYDINNDVFPTRLDILYGWAVLRPELACRMQS
jgi:hypothetical protein